MTVNSSITEASVPPPAQPYTGTMSKPGEHMKSSQQVQATRQLRTKESLHVQFMEDLKTRLETGEWAAGEQLPTESALSKEYGISRVTVRTGIKLLAAQGLIHTRQGVGTFVTPFGAQAHAGLQELRSLTETLRQQGFEPIVECRRAELAPASPQAIEALALKPGSSTLHLERVFRGKGKAIAFSYEELAADALPDTLTMDDFHGSLFELLTTHSNFYPAYAVANVRPTISSSVGWPGEGSANDLYLEVTQTHFTASGRPFLLSCNYFVDQRIEFTVMRVLQ